MSQTQKDANQLAADRTEMAFRRTVMALERSLMAWVRTAVSLIGFGFTIFKFLEGLAREGAAIREHSPRNLGLFLIFLGIGMLILGMMQYKQSLKKLAGINEEKAPFSLAMIAAGAVILVGIFTLLNMLFGFGGF